MFIGQLRAMGMAKEVTAGVLVTPPTVFLPYIPPDSFMTAITLLPTMGIRAVPDKIYKASQGPAEMKGLKLKLELEPENCGQILQAAFGSDVMTGSAQQGFLHTFQRQAVTQLPTYSIWWDKGAKYFQFLGTMCSKLDIGIKAREYIFLETEWVAQTYDDTGITRSPTYSPRKAFIFSNCQVKVDGVVINNYDNIKISFDNYVKADHALSGSIYPAKIYSEGFECTVTMDLFVEDSTQYQKFLSGSSAALNFQITSSEAIAGSNPTAFHQMIIDIPTINYTVFSLPAGTGVLKYSITAKGIYTVSSAKTASVSLLNSVGQAY